MRRSPDGLISEGRNGGGHLRRHAPGSGAPAVRRSLNHDFGRLGEALCLGGAAAAVAIMYSTVVSLNTVSSHVARA